MLSIVILCYKNFDGIEETIKRIANQTYQNIELMISDDGSEEFDVALVEEILAPFKTRFSYSFVNKNEKNMGTVKHINSLFTKLHGDIILYQGCDDLLYDENVISDVMAYFEQSNAKIVTTQRVLKSKNGSDFVLPEAADAKAIEKGGKELLHHICKKGNVISGCGTFYSKSVFEEYGYFDEDCRLVEDYSFYMKVLHKGEKIHFLPRKALCYAWGGCSTSRNPMVERDKQIVFQKYIYPMKHTYSWSDQRTIEFRFQREKKDNHRLSVGLVVKYLDVIIRQMVINLIERKKQSDLAKKMGD